MKIKISSLHKTKTLTKTRIKVQMPMIEIK